MKKVIAFLLFGLLFTMNYSGFSQSRAKFGLKAGLNYSTITNTNLEYKPGFYAGSLLDISFSDFYTMQPELTYSGQGASSKIGGDINIHYISVALANKFFIANKTGFHLIAGMGVDIDFEDNFRNLANNGFESNNNIFFMDISFFLGMGYELNNGLTFEGRYKHGSIGVFSDEFFEENNNRYNSLFQFGVSYKFD